jgi:hypothetical protein
VLVAVLVLVVEVVVLVVVVVPEVKLLLLSPEATQAIAPRTRPPPKSIHVVLSSISAAFLTPAGLPAGKGAVSVAAMALEAINVAAIDAATKFRMGLLLLAQEFLVNFLQSETNVSTAYILFVRCNVTDQIELV